MKILAIETSCDETAAAIAQGEGEKVKIVSNIVSSQIKIHEKYGGVIPEMAAREHVKQILPVIEAALDKAGIKKQDAKEKLDAIAVTQGPGLITSLITGIETAKSLAYAWGLPLVGVNHVEGHVSANFINNEDIKFPLLVLTVSGGHTILVLMEGHGRFKALGETRDDAAGEAFDKAAQMLGLGYPGGPAISSEAKKAQKNNDIKLPRPMIDSPDFDFSFSGLKTALLYEIQGDQEWQDKVSEYAYEFEQAIVEVLVHKTAKAAKKYNVKTVLLAGGVAANMVLREELKNKIESMDNIQFFMPELKYTTDNAAMIAAAAYFKVREKKFTPWNNIRVDCNLDLS